MAKDTAYHQAEQKIEEARRSGATTLELQGMELAELPETIGQLTGLQSLNLFGNRLRVLPIVLKQLKRLEKLNLSYNQLTELPDWLEEFACLQSLWLYKNQFEKPLNSPKPISTSCCCISPELIITSPVSSS